MTSTVPASMGGPLSEADRLAEIRARAELFNSADALWLLDKVDQLLTHNGVLVTEVRFQAERADDAIAVLRETQGRFDTATARVGVLEGQLATAQEQLRKLSKLQCQPTDSDDSELSWEDGYNAALAEVRYLAAEVLPETIAERHHAQEVYLEFHEFPVQSSKRVICAECSGQPVPWDVDEASIVLWPCAEAVALGLDGGGSDA